MSPSTFSTAFHNFSKHLQHHHEDVQAAYEAYYGSPTGSRNHSVVGHNTSPSSSKKHSTEALDSAISSESAPVAVRAATATESTPIPQTHSSVWSKIKEHAKEHHQSVNAAFDLYYHNNSR